MSVSIDSYLFIIKFIFLSKSDIEDETDIVKLLHADKSSNSVPFFKYISKSN